ncbi:MAG: U32 family peptidase [Candidatus Micrarchaeota archaeon]
MEGPKTKFCVANNNRGDCIPRITKRFAPHLEEFFGSAPPDISGSARLVTSHSTTESLKRDICEARRHGVGYNVLLNSIVHPQLTDTNFMKRICGFLELIAEWGATAVTITDTFLMDVAAEHRSKKSLPLKIVASSWCDILGPTKAKRIEGRGADRIILHQDANRNIADLGAIISQVKCEVELLANNGCLYRCDARQAHRVFQSLHSTSGERIADPFRAECIRIRREDPFEILLSPTIRPEDVGLYESMGFHLFKIAGRLQSTDWLEYVVEAYVKREFNDSLPKLASTNDGEKLPRICNKRLDGFLQFVTAGHALGYTERVREFYDKFLENNLHQDT